MLLLNFYRKINKRRYVPILGQNKRCANMAYSKGFMITPRFLKMTPAVAVLVTAIGVMIWFKWQLVNDIDRFGREFVHQNSPELAAGDTLALTRKLEALLPALSWVCVQGERANIPFYSRKAGECGNGLLRKQIEIALPENPDMRVRVTLTAPMPTVVITGILISGQVALLCLLWLGGRAMEKEQAAALIAKERAESATARAIAASVQMVSHDVRKPFSTIKIGIGMLSRARDMDQVHKTISRLVPEIEKSLRNVNGLLADLMEIGSTSTQVLGESCSPRALIAAAVADTLLRYPTSKITLSYDLGHKSTVYVDPLKVSRVLENLITNAIQALPKQSGSLWIKTREGRDLVEFVIGNPGYLAPEIRTQLFGSFFTHGKKGGTGLGLAICRKIVTACGGTIECRSDKTADFPDGKVEFCFTLPTNRQLNQVVEDTSKDPLPNSLSDVQGSGYSDL